MRLILIILSAFILTACVSNSSFFYGENLLQPMPFPEKKWEVYSAKDGNVNEMLWSNNDNTDQVKTNIFLNASHRDVEEEKIIDENVGKKICEKFEASDTEVEIENSYETLTWITRCQYSPKETISVLHKAISGADSFYHIRRIWRYLPSEDDLALWENYFSKIKVCDTRYSSENACPKNYRKI